jgi:hypothetical protein
MLDEHGIKKIYQDSDKRNAPASFVMGVGNWRNRIAKWDRDDDDVIGSFEGSGLDIIFTSSADDKQRMNVYADPSKPEAPEDADELDRSDLAARPDSDGVQRGGWMVQENDWRDYEVTAVEFLPRNVEDGSGNPARDTTAWYGRGAKHTGESLGEASQGSAYKVDLWYAGNKNGWHVLKETLHFDPFKNSSRDTCRPWENDSRTNTLHIENIGNVKGKWIGIKTVVYNQGKKTGADGADYWPVMMEAYTCDCDQNGNPDNNTWDLKFQCEDDFEKHGRWSSLPNGQPGPDSHTISWGGPIITCRTDRQSGTGGGYPGMKFKKVSIREIKPGIKY